jgi:hypothetical protein
LPKLQKTLQKTLQKDKKIDDYINSKQPVYYKKRYKKKGTQNAKTDTISLFYKKRYKKNLCVWEIKKKFFFFAT